MGSGSWPYQIRHQQQPQSANIRARVAARANCHHHQRVGICDEATEVSACVVWTYVDYQSGSPMMRRCGQFTWLCNTGTTGVMPMPFEIRISLAWYENHSISFC